MPCGALPVVGKSLQSALHHLHLETQDTAAQTHGSHLACVSDLFCAPDVQHVNCPGVVARCCQECSGIIGCWILVLTGSISLRRVNKVTSGKRDDSTFRSVKTWFSRTSPMWCRHPDQSSGRPSESCMPMQADHVDNLVSAAPVLRQLACQPGNDHSTCLIGLLLICRDTKQFQPLCISNKGVMILILNQNRPKLIHNLEQKVKNGMKKTC